MKKSRLLITLFATTMLLGVVAPTIISAEEIRGEWREENGEFYWYENGVKQGTEGRGKEIYDPGTKAWYWLDAEFGGRKAVSKDVYQESESGIWGDLTNEDGITVGKWVRYDENGHMVKGWDGDYYFDPIYGTMAKGYATIDGNEYYFNAGTGVKEQELGEVPEFGWKNINGNEFWYENGIRQGYSVKAGYRGKEIFDPKSNAWYWLDNVDGGKKATNKDVYQESKANDTGDIGKWVRYDENGHMIKGWSEKDGEKYYFDPVYGTMAKGEVEIEGTVYYFNVDSGICEGAKMSLEEERYMTEQIVVPAYEKYIYDTYGSKTYVSCNLIYIDNDNIPELLYDDSGDGRGTIVLAYYKDNVIESDAWSRGFEFYYIPKGNKVSYEGTMRGDEVGAVAHLENGVLVEECSYEFDFNDAVGEGGKYYINDTECSKEEFNNFREDNFDLDGALYGWEKTYSTIREAYENLGKFTFTEDGGYITKFEMTGNILNVETEEGKKISYPVSANCTWEATSYGEVYDTYTYESLKELMDLERERYLENPNFYDGPIVLGIDVEDEVIIRIYTMSA